MTPKKLVDLVCHALNCNKSPRTFSPTLSNPLFVPAHVVGGINYFRDKMLQGRLLSYSDAPRYRQGATSERIPVDKCPHMVANYQRDRMMRVDGKGGSDSNYYPNTFDDLYAGQ